jgi:hypothetical protein
VITHPATSHHPPVHLAQSITAPSILVFTAGTTTSAGSLSTTRSPTPAHSLAVYSLTAHAHAHMAPNAQTARIKPEQQKIELNFRLNPSSENYDVSKGQQIADSTICEDNESGASAADTTTQMFPSGAMDSFTLRSSRVPFKAHYMVGMVAVRGPEPKSLPCVCVCVWLSKGGIARWDCK